MNAPINISGERYGRLVATARVRNGARHTYWAFRCDCGADVVTELHRVRSGMTKSCGCLRADTTRDRSLKHGHSTGYRHSRTLRAWNHAKGRCFNANDEKYPLYGGRGITMCKAWVESFSAFLADMGECPPGQTLDRMDVHGHYEPRNCRWATAFQQARTRTNNVIVAEGGIQMVLKDFASLKGVRYKHLHWRMRSKGESAHEAAAYILGR